MQIPPIGLTNFVEIIILNTIGYRNFGSNRNELIPFNLFSSVKYLLGYCGCKTADYDIYRVIGCNPDDMELEVVTRDDAIPRKSRFLFVNTNLELEPDTIPGFLTKSKMCYDGSQIDEGPTSTYADTRSPAVSGDISDGIVDPVDPAPAAEIVSAPKWDGNPILLDLRFNESPGFLIDSSNYHRVINVGSTNFDWSAIQEAKLPGRDTVYEGTGALKIATQTYTWTDPNTGISSTARGSDGIATNTGLSNFTINDQPFTVELYMYLTDIQMKNDTIFTLVNYGYPDDSKQWSLEYLYIGGASQFRLSENHLTQTFPWGSAIDNETWYHIVAQRNPGSAPRVNAYTMFVDDVPLASPTGQLLGLPIGKAPFVMSFARYSQGLSSESRKGHITNSHSVPGQDYIAYFDNIRWIKGRYAKYIPVT